MKLRKIILGSVALLFAGTAFAQIHIGGYVDFTSTVAEQKIYKTGDGDITPSDVIAELGPSQNGIHFLNIDAVGQNVEFHTGTWLGSGIGSWYHNVTMFPDRTTGTGTWASTSIYQAYLVTKFWGDQLRFYSGNFASNGFNAGYVNGGYAGGVHIDNLAMRGSAGNTNFTGVEWIPNMSVLNGALVGFRAIVGFPISPLTSDFTNFNSWKNMYKAVKFMGSYKWMRPNLTFNFGVRPCTYSMSATSGTDFTKSMFGEAFLQVDMPTTIPGIPALIWTDFRWRSASVDAENTASGKEWTSTAFASMSGISISLPSQILGWKFNVGDKFGFYGPHYIAVNEMAFENVLTINGTHAFAGTPYSFGFETYLMYGQDANGGMISRSDEWCSDLITYNWNYMGAAASPASGTPGRYIGAYAYPYVQKNFANGFARTGVEIQYTRYETSSTNQAISWRIPLGLTFWY